MDWMSPMDASFLHIEGPNNPMHIGGVSVFEGPPPGFDRLSEMVASKLDAVPRYRQKVRFVPLGIARPVWVEDPHFSLTYHLRHSALPAPGSDEVLRHTAARIFAQHLDRRKPLWEIWMIEGLGDRRWALLSKVHHCMVDGVSATDLMTVIFDDSPMPEPGQPWRAAPEPSAGEIVVRSLARAASSPSEQLRVVRAGLRRPGATLAQAGEVVRGITSSRGLLRPLERSSLIGSIGPHRTWSTALVALEQVKAIRTSLGGTVNDVVLSLVAGGLRELLAARGEEVEGRVVRTTVPVSVRAPGERGVYNNRVSAMVAELPVGIADPVARLSAIRAQMDGLKQSKQAVAGDVLISLSGFAPPMLLALGCRLAARSPSLGVQTGVTNVPGPQQALRTLDRKLMQAYPFVPLIGNLRITIAIFSYDGGLYFGVTGDYDSSDDIALLTAGVEAAAGQLLALAQERVGSGEPDDSGARGPAPAPA
jgi:diacylglycerol O-acyltransferase / wax synthase